MSSNHFYIPKLYKQVHGREEAAKTKFHEFVRKFRDPKNNQHIPDLFTVLSHNASEWGASFGFMLEELGDKIVIALCSHGFHFDNLDVYRIADRSKQQIIKAFRAKGDIVKHDIGFIIIQNEYKDIKSLKDIGTVSFNHWQLLGYYHWDHLWNIQFHTGAFDNSQLAVYEEIRDCFSIFKTRNVYSWSQALLASGKKDLWKNTFWIIEPVIKPWTSGSILFNDKGIGGMLFASSGNDKGVFIPIDFIVEQYERKIKPLLNR